MKKNIRISSAHKAITRRYLLWAYKSTKESFERIERKTTQLVVDRFILEQLEASSEISKECSGQVEEFKSYIAQKQADELKLKFKDGDSKRLSSQYLFLKTRLKAIESAIKNFLGDKEAKKIEALFEAEFTRRILESKDH